MSAWLLDPFFDWLIARLNRPRPLGLRWVFTLSPTTLNEGNDMGILRVGVPKKISLIVRNKDGSAGLIDGLPAWTNETPDFIDPVRDKPRRSGRGRIARTAQPFLGFGFSVGSAAARCTGARWKSAHRRSLKRSRRATTARLSSSASGYRAALCAAGDWRRP